MIVCRIVIEYKEEKKARSIYESVNIENKGYVKGKFEGNRIVFEVSGENALSISHTVNDLLACVKAAENSII